MTVAAMTRTKLKDVCDRITVGHVGPMAEKYTEKGVPFLRSQNITPFSLQLDDIKYVPPEFHKQLKKCALRPGDVAVVRTGYPGTACVIPESLPEANCADLVVITPSKSLNPYYLAAIFNSAWGKSSVAGNLVGVAQQHFNVGAAREMEIRLPSKMMQDRIAGILSAYDDLIENNQQRIKILEEMARSLYREWFVNFRFPGHEKVKMVASSLASIPQGWEVKKLGEVIELNYGKALRHDTRREGQIHVFGSSGIVGYHDTSLVKGPGIIVGRKGNVGSVFWSDADFYPIDTAYFVTSSLPLRFMFYELQTKNFINNDAAVPGLSRHQAYSLETIIPPSDLLTCFCRLANDFEQQAAKLRLQIENLRRTRDLLLPRLLSGQLQLGAAGITDHAKNC